MCIIELDDKFNINESGTCPDSYSVSSSCDNPLKLKYVAVTEDDY